mgnify:CR=1 FL=1
MTISPVLAGLATYPFVRLDEARARLRAAGVELLDFGTGEPREETPEFIRHALVEAVAPMSTYPSAAGLPELREAISGWVSRRFGASLDPDHVIPTLGSKEAIYGLANVLDGDFEPNAEVDELRWLGLDDALACLTYDHDHSNVLMAVRHAAHNR